MPTIDVLGIGNEVALPELYAQCMRSLCDHSRIVIFSYPAELRVPHATDALWFSRTVAIRDLNEESLLGRLTNRVNCYAIHTRAKRGDWRLRYIGQTDSRRAKGEIAARLAPNRGLPNTVFAKCREAVSGGFEIGLRLIRVEPDTLRFFIQEKAVNELRTKDFLDWNRKL